MVKVNVLNDNEAIAKDLATFIIKQQDAVLSTGNEFNIAISGGSLISILAKGLLNNEKIEWPKWKIYFSDERIVPLHDKDSNYGAFQTEILDKLAHQGVVGPTVITINESLVHATDDKTDAEIASVYESEIPPNGLDLVLLGCGPDGHTCSLFPNHKLLSETSKQVSYLNDSPKLPLRRITLTLPYLEKCHTLCFVATGESKKTVLKEIFETPEQSKLPCAIVNQLKTEGGICWFVDDAAVEGISLPK